jgi:inositol phosphorylceramide mannosyltransferase catalytic subunit
MAGIPSWVHEQYFPNDSIRYNNHNDNNNQMDIDLPFPRIIHQTWKTNIVPEDWQPSQDAWQVLFPTWKYRLWTDKENREFMKTYYPKHLDIYDSWKYPIQRADMIRYYRLHFQGGGYCDLDNQPRINFEHLFYHTNNEAYFVPGYDYGFTNAIMFSKPRAKIWEDVFQEMRDAAENPYYQMMPKHFHVMNTTGPWMLTRVLVRQQHSAIGILPANLNPFPENEGHPTNIPNARKFMIKLRSGSWHGWDTKFMMHFATRRKFYIVLGIICILIGLFVLLRLFFCTLWSRLFLPCWRNSVGHPSKQTFV